MKAIGCYLACMQRMDGRRLAELTRYILEDTGLSQRGLARLAGVSESQVSRWLHGDTQPKYETVQALATALARDYPGLAGVVPDLFAAAGYEGANLPPDPRPDIVRENWHDERVRTIWNTPGMPIRARLGIIEHYLAERDFPADDGTDAVPG